MQHTQKGRHLRSALGPVSQASPIWLGGTENGHVCLAGAACAPQVFRVACPNYAARPSLLPPDSEPSFNFILKGGSSVRSTKTGFVKCPHADSARPRAARAVSLPPHLEQMLLLATLSMHTAGARAGQGQGKEASRVTYATHSSGLYTFSTATHSEKDSTLPKMYRYIHTHTTVETKFQKTTLTPLFLV